MAGRRGSSGPGRRCNAALQSTEAAGLFAWALAKFLRELSPPFSSWHHLKRTWQAALGTKRDKGNLILPSNTSALLETFGHFLLVQNPRARLHLAPLLRVTVKQHTAAA